MILCYDVSSFLTVCLLHIKDKKCPKKCITDAQCIGLCQKSNKCHGVKFDLKYLQRTKFEERFCLNISNYLSFRETILSIHTIMLRVCCCVALLRSRGSLHGGQTTCFNWAVNALLLSLAALNCCCNLLMQCPSTATQRQLVWIWCNTNPIPARRLAHLKTFTWQNLTPAKRITMSGILHLGESSHLSCKRDQVKMRNYMDRWVTSAERVTSPTWGSPGFLHPWVNRPLWKVYSASNEFHVSFMFFLFLHSLFWSM